jgi:hypothetical protein
MVGIREMAEIDDLLGKRAYLAAVSGDKILASYR